MSLLFRTDKKEKAQIRDGYHPSVFSEDTTHTPHIEGSLLKKNPYGMMQARHFYINNGYLIYKKSKNDRDIKGVIDLRDTSEFVIRSDKPTDIEVRMKSQDMDKDKHKHALLRAASEDEARRWVLSVQQRMDWCSEQADRRKVAEDHIKAEELRAKTRRTSRRMSVLDSTNDISREGWLRKESAGSGAFQDRYVRVSGQERVLRYYRNDQVDEQAGTVNLESCFSRAFDAQEDNCKFEVGDKQRVYTFECETHHQMKDWLRTLEDVKGLITKENEAIKKAQEQLDTPILIRIMDEQGLDELVDCIGEELAEMFPEDMFEDHDGDGSIDVRGHLKAASDLVGYISDAVADTGQCEQFPVGRLDVLAVVMVLTNLTLESRLEDVVLGGVDGDVSRGSVSQSRPSTTTTGIKSKVGAKKNGRLGGIEEGDEDQEDEEDQDQDDEEEDGVEAGKGKGGDIDAAGATPVQRSMSVSDCYALIDWIGKFEYTLKEIYCPPTDYADGRNPLENGLFQFLPELCKKYEEACAGPLKQQCVTVWDNFTKDPATAIQKHQDGTFYTHQPTDIWEALNNHLSLATSTNAKLLHVLVADRIVDAITAIAKLTQRYVQNMSIVFEEDPSLREMELELLSALANDTAMHIEEVIAVVHSFKLEQIRSHIDELFDDVSDLLVICGQSCLNRLVKVVLADVNPILDDLWTEGWCKGEVKVTASALATTGDYMQDFAEFLVPFWASKVAKEVFSTLVVRYGQVLLAQSHKEKTAKISNTFGSMFKGMTGKNNKKLVKITEAVVVQMEHDINTFRLVLEQQLGGGEDEEECDGNVTDEIISLLEDVMNMVGLEDANEVFELTAERINEYPSSAKEVALLCYKVLFIRPDCGKQTAEEVEVMLAPTVEAAEALAELRDDEGVVEGWRGKMYHELIPNVGAGAKQATIASRLKALAKAPVQAINKMREEEDADEDAFDERPSEQSTKPDPVWSAKRASVMNLSASRRMQKDQLMDVVMGVLQTEDGKNEADKMLLAEAQHEAQEKEKHKGNDIIEHSGTMEKRGGMGGLSWQSRFFKITTRSSAPDADSGVIDRNYFISWYKKEGGSMAKSYNIRDKVMGMSLLWSSRELSYSIEAHTVRLKERQSISKRTFKKLADVPKHGHEEHALVETIQHAQCYVFQLHVREGQGVRDGERDIVLKTARVDDLVDWMNVIIRASDFRYHGDVGGWVAPSVSNEDIRTSIGHDEREDGVFSFFQKR